MALELFLTEHIPPTQAHHQGWPARDYHHVRFFDDDYYYLGRLDHPFSYRLTWLLCYIMCCWNGAALSLRQNDVVQGASKFLTYLLGVGWKDRIFRVRLVGVDNKDWRLSLFI